MRAERQGVEAEGIDKHLGDTPALAHQVIKVMGQVIAKGQRQKWQAEQGKQPFELQLLASQQSLSGFDKQGKDRHRDDDTQ